MRFSEFALAVSLALLTTNARSESCRDISDTAKRLACFDAITTTAPGPSGPAAAPVSRWQINESKSPVDDSLQVAAVNQSTTDAGKAAILMIRCKEHDTEFFVSADEFWGLSIGGRPIPVTYRVNDAPATKQAWTPGSGSSARGSSAFVPNVKQALAFMASLPEGGRLFLRVEDFQGIGHDMTFNLDGITEVKSRVADACRPKPHRP